MSGRRGHFVLVLHSHLPYVIGHGRWPHGTDWLAEAALETYIPLLAALRRLVHDGISPRITVGITPVLAEQLAHPAFAEEFERYVKEKRKVAVEDAASFRRAGHTARADLAEHWVRNFDAVLERFEVELSGNILGAWRELQDAGHVEIITSGATHGYLPLLGSDRSVDTQVSLGCRTYRRHFGRAPRGIWLPECAYRPRYVWERPVHGELGPNPEPAMRQGVDEVVSQNGLRYFIVDSHLLQGGKPIGVYLDRFEALRDLWERASRAMVERALERAKTPLEAYLVMSNPEGDVKPVAILTRHPRVSLQVWSGEHGYPGEAAYLDFHKKHYTGGLRYWRVTGPNADLADKEEYGPDAAQLRVVDHACHFVELVESLLVEYQRESGRPGLVCAPFDTELFGHWWHEGVDWIEAVLRRMAESEVVRAATASEQLEASPPATVVAIPEGSWGEGGFHFIWLNEHTEWTWKHIYDDEDRMTALAERYLGMERGGRDSDLGDVLKQAGRELLLLQSSDWPFLISTRSARDYAETRICRHHEDFAELAAIAERLLAGGEMTPADRAELAEIAERDDLFPDVEIGEFAGRREPAPARRS